MTGHIEEVSAETLRKQEQRAREKAAGVSEVEVKMGPIERAMLDAGRTLRGGHAGPYTATEYILTLLRRDNELLQQQQGALVGRMCENCRKPLPRGCGGFWAKESLCLAAQAGRALEL